MYFCSYMERKNKSEVRVRSIKTKVRTGFMLIALILFFSSIVSLFEFTRMNRVITRQISDNVNTVNIGRDMIVLTEDYNLGVFNAISGAEAASEKAGGQDAPSEGGSFDERLYSAHNEEFIRQFSSTMEEMRQSFTARSTFSEKNYADSVLLAYTAYMHVLHEGGDILSLEAPERQEWYFNRLQPYYLKLRDYIQSLTNASQEALIANSKKVDATFYRSITPAIASVAVGLLLVLLFNYFINFYLIKPLIRISGGIGSYRKYRKEYNVEVDNNGDELSQLNDNVRNLIEDYTSMEKGSGDKKK